MKNGLYLLIFFLPVFTNAQWIPAASFRHDAAHSGDFGDNGDGGFGALQWKFKTGGKIFGSPVVDRETVYIGSEDKTLYALRLQDGKPIWTFHTGGPIYSTPAVFRKAVYFGSYDGHFYALDRLSGKLIWKFNTGGEKKMGAKGLWTMKPRTQYMDDPFDFFLSSPVIDEQAGRVIFGSGDGHVYALNIGDGRLAWKFATRGIIHASPALWRGTVYIGSWDRQFYAIDAQTGKEKWRFTTRRDTAIHLLEGIQSSATVYDEKVFFGSRDGHYYALDAHTGTAIWAFDANNSWVLTSGAAKDHTIYIGTSDTYQILALDANTGATKYKVQANGYVYSSPSISGHSLYVGDFTGKLFSMNITDGKIIGEFITEGRKNNADSVLQQDKIDFNFLAKGLDLEYYSATVIGMKKLYRLGPILSSPVIDKKRIYFGSADGYLYVLALKQDSSAK